MYAAPRCKGCQDRPVAMNNQTKKYFAFCKPCTCQQPRCFLRALHESGFCDQHNQQHAQQEEFVGENQQQQQPQRMCAVCMKPSQGYYCGPCNYKVPKCPCGKKVTTDKENGKFFQLCQFCKCKNKFCGTPKYPERDFCEPCIENSHCATCGGRKSVNFNDANCRRCQTPDCKTPDCGQKTGFYKTEDGEEATFEYCKSCTCTAKECFESKVNNWLCSSHTAEQKNFCVQDNCARPIARGQKYCGPCEFAWGQKKIKCPTSKCSGYMFDKKNINVCCLCKEKEMKTPQTQTFSLEEAQ